MSIEWIDSCGTNGWTAKERSDLKFMSIKSVGFIIHEDDDSVTIASSYNPNVCHSPITIPRAAITKMKVIRS